MDKEEREAVQSVIETKQIEDVQKVNTDQLVTKQNSNEIFPCDKCDQTFQLSSPELDRHKLTV